MKLISKPSDAHFENVNIAMDCTYSSFICENQPELKQIMN